MMSLENMQNELGESRKRREKMRTRNVVLKTKALEVIEGLCLLNEKDEPFYRIAHVALGSCGNPHKDWREELDKEYKQLIKDGVI